MPAGDYLLAVDQGTTSSRAYLFDRGGRVAAWAQQELRQSYPKPGWVEHDPDEIWASCAAVIRSTIRQAKIRPSQIVAIGLTNQRETTIVWERLSGRPVHPAIVWQCRRTTEICRRLKARRLEPLFRARTGLVLDAYFSGPKITWLLERVPGLRARAAQGKLCFGTVDSWLLWQLTKGRVHATDVTNASRTLLFNLRSRQWDPTLLKALRVPASMLPRVLPSSGAFGRTAAAVAGLPAGIPILGIAGDQQAALFGQRCTRAGMMKNTYGTGCFLLLHTGHRPVRSRHGLITTVACDARGQPAYALEGSVFIGGAAIQWLRDELGLVATAAETEAIAAGVEDTHGVYVVPAFTGLGAPRWRPEARGLICGLTRGTTRAHLIRATLESIAYQTRDVVEAMSRDARLRIRALQVDGGACKNNFLMQFQADLLHCAIVRPRMVETTALGAAQLAGVAASFWTPAQLDRMRAVDRTFTPHGTAADRRRRYDGWRRAVAKTLA
ncbi:MAG: glycerol kinase GlpK [Candidatus Omnitrophica bacterium]|nr:glycerol kinase GlpK [Candidatus Omnitrophota bacterium]